MTSFMPAPVTSFIGKRAVAVRLWAGTHLSSPMPPLHSCMGLPGLYGGRFSDVSTHKAHCTADLPMHLGGVVWAHQKGAGLSAAGARLHSLN